MWPWSSWLGQRPRSKTIVFGCVLLALKFWLKLIKKWLRYDLQALKAKVALVWPLRAKAKK